MYSESPSTSPEEHNILLVHSVVPDWKIRTSSHPRKQLYTSTHLQYYSAVVPNGLFITNYWTRLANMLSMSLLWNPSGLLSLLHNSLRSPVATGLASRNRRRRSNHCSASTKNQTNCDWAKSKGVREAVRHLDECTEAVALIVSLYLFNLWSHILRKPMGQWWEGGSI